ncbi:MAG: SGNH/GDSL hydrolase family protein [Bacteroidia bacterium]
MAVLLLELFLRIYNPFPTRIKGDKIILPVNKKYEFKNKKVNGLEPYIIHTKNSLGFRGEELPADLEKRISIITVGGSTTECLYLSDGKDWPNVVGKKLKSDIPDIWLNNAGLDGHSTFGHTILLQDYLVKLKPDYVLFLIGTNDVEREDLSKFDSMHIRNYSTNRNWKGKLVEHSEIANVLYNISSVYKAKNQELTHFSLKLSKADTFVLKKEDAQKALNSQDKFLEAYKFRLKNIIKICRENKIQPVFITQPYLLGFGIDSLTGADLAKVKIGERDGATQWQILQMYNEVTKQVGTENKVPVIDLANKMPKQSVYFYDQAHFTNAGANTVAEIVAGELLPYLHHQ